MSRCTLPAKSDSKILAQILLSEIPAAGLIGRTLVLYICVSFWLLAHESCDLSEDETKISLGKIHKRQLYSLKIIIFSNLTILTDESIFAQLVTTINFASAWGISHDSSANSQKLTQV